MMATPICALLPTRSIQKVASYESVSLCLCAPMQLASIKKNFQSIPILSRRITKHNLHGLFVLLGISCTVSIDYPVYLFVTDRCQLLVAPYIHYSHTSESPWAFISTSPLRLHPLPWIWSFPQWIPAAMMEEVGTHDDARITDALQDAAQTYVTQGKPRSHCTVASKTFQPISALYMTLHKLVWYSDSYPFRSVMIP